MNVNSIYPRIYFLIILLFLFSGADLHAQQKGPGSRGVNPDSLRKSLPKIGEVNGLISDAASGEPVIYASVAVYSLSDSSIAGGALTDEKGRFSISELPMGRHRLQITFIGYTTQVLEPFILSPMKPVHAVGQIKLNASTARLKEVEISAEKLDLIHSLDKKVYNLDKNIINTGGSVTDAMQNIPSVAVDIDGNVSLRGSENVTILIDGKPSGMLGSDRRAVLSQIPANAVDQIEVITNPSAKYDASGMAGIINIKTKKEKMRGMNGNVTAGIGTNNKYNLSLGLNNRTAKANYYVNYSFRHDNRASTGDGTQFNYFPGKDPYSYVSTSSGKRIADFHSAKIGMDFNLNQWNNFGVSASVNTRIEDDPDQNQYIFRDMNEIIYSQYQSSSQSDESNDGYDLNLDYRRTWAGSKREVTATAGYSANRRLDDVEVQNSVYGIGFTPYQLSDNENKFSNLILQADLFQPVTESGRLEAGLKSTLRSIDNDQLVYTFDTPSDAYYLNTNKSDHFIYNEQVLGAYMMYSGKWRKFDYNAGLRAEQTLSEGESVTDATTFTNDYLSFFPSAFLKYNFGKGKEAQFSYSRRVNRPDTRSLNPHTDYSDSLFLRTGNPYVKPEFIQSYELAYTQPVGGAFDVTGTIYYRYTDDMISRYRQLDTATSVSTLTVVNYNSSSNLGAELVLRYELKNFGNIMATVNAYQNKIEADNIESDLQSESEQWNGRLSLNFKAGKTTSFQVSGNYSSPRVSPTSKFRGMSGVDAGVKQDLWKGKGSLSFNITDIFYTRKFRVSHFDDYYESEYVRTRESRVATISLSYRFGNQDSNLFQRKKNQRNQQQNEGMEMIEY